MAYLADTNVISRWTQPRDPHYAACRTAVSTLRARGERVYITAQNILEYWSLATRPVDVNGLGLTVGQVIPRVRLLLRHFPILPETAEIFPIWQTLVETQAIVGRQVYDARIVAVMQAHSLTHILTMNPAHFRRYPGITVVDPHSV